MAIAIETIGLRRTFGEFVAVDHLDLEVEAGTFFGFLGPNGAGKSTTIKMLTGLLGPSSGTARILGNDVMLDAIEAKKQTGVVPEESALFDRLTGEEYLRFVGRMYGMTRPLIDERSDELLDLLGLADPGRQLIVDYSHGMRKKLSFCAAIMHEPKVLFLDEPFEGIDAVSSKLIRSLLSHLVESGVTIFLTSHILEIVEKLCTRGGDHPPGPVGGAGHAGRPPNGSRRWDGVPAAEASRSCFCLSWEVTICRKGGFLGSVDDSGLAEMAPLVERAPWGRHGGGYRCRGSHRRSRHGGFPRSRIWHQRSRTPGLRDGDPEAGMVGLQIFFWVLAFLGVIVPVVFGMGESSLPLSRLAMYPLSRRGFYGLSVAASIFSANHLFWFPILFGVTFTVLSLDGVPAGPWFVVVGAFMLVIFVWCHTARLMVQRVMRRRSVRELAALISLVVVVTVSLVPAIFESQLKEEGAGAFALPGWLLSAGKAIASIFPASIAAEGANAAFSSDATTFAFSLAWLTLWLGAGAFLGFRLLVSALFEGGSSSGGRRVVSSPRPGRSGGRYNLDALPWLPLPVRAIAAKEMHYLLRSTTGKFNIAIMPVFVIVVALVVVRDLSPSILGIESANLVFVGTMLYASDVFEQLPVQLLRLGEGGHPIVLRVPGVDT